MLEFFLKSALQVNNFCRMFNFVLNRLIPAYLTTFCAIDISLTFVKLK